jgi:hypothetical protein
LRLRADGEPSVEGFQPFVHAGQAEPAFPCAEIEADAKVVDR